MGVCKPAPRRGFRLFQGVRHWSNDPLERRSSVCLWHILGRPDRGLHAR